MEDLTFSLIQSTADAYKILVEFNNEFDPPLDSRVFDLETYATKLVNNGYVYILLADKRVLGFIAFYANDNSSNIGYLSQIAVKADCILKDIGYKLLKQFEKISYDNRMKKLKLEVNDNNKHAINFYKRNGYEYWEKASENSSYMIKKLI